MRSTFVCEGRSTLSRPSQRGASLIICLLLLLAVAMLGASAAHIAVQSEKASRANEDRQLALLAAEAALMDAQRDIDASLRSRLFIEASADIFVANCGRGLSNPHLGLCKAAGAGMPPAWHLIDGDANASVPYGHITGADPGVTMSSAHSPAYLIELMPRDGKSTTHVYRITAIGFGRKEATQVVLQALVRKGDGPAIRAGWREILNWKDMTNV